MAKSRKLEELTTELNQIRSDPTSADGQAVLSRIIGSKQGVVVAQAAQLVSEFEMHALIPDLAIAFERFMIKPANSDPGCRAKQAIADALYRLEYREESLFLRGIRHVQREPVWGGQVDTAPQLRGTCALGLVRMNYPNVMIELTDLLADPEQEARIGAARAISYSENPLGVALLRFRIKVGDTPAVLGECIAALLDLSAHDGLSLAATCLESGRKDSDPRDAIETAEITALALGESRLPAALPLLRDWWKRTSHGDLRQTGLLAIATLRQDEALQFLRLILAEGAPQDARLALEALGLYQNDDFLWSQVQEILRHRNDL